jgi:hypothetical protein
MTLRDAQEEVGKKSCDRFLHHGARPRLAGILPTQRTELSLGAARTEHEDVVCLFVASR